MWTRTLKSSQDLKHNAPQKHHNEKPVHRPFHGLNQVSRVELRPLRHGDAAEAKQVDCWFQRLQQAKWQ